MSVNLTPQKSAVSPAFVGKTDTLRFKEIATTVKTEKELEMEGWGGDSPNERDREPTHDADAVEARAGSGATTGYPGAPSVAYDRHADVLYISLTDPPQPARTVEGTANVLWRYKDGRLVGVTILHLGGQAAAPIAGE